MRKILVFVVLFTGLRLVAQTPQILYGGHYLFDVNNSWGLGEKEYVARDYVWLQNGFRANSFIGQYFRARIDDKLIVPVDYSSTTPFDEASAAAIDYNLPVGSIEGSAAVGPDGSANYTIPIVVPPGINGVQPQLSVAYNSNISNGLLGIGWNLNGISTITRMSKTVFKDGDLAGINLDGNDLFALDGQRLVLESPATYGGDGVYYRTETESNIRILSHGMQGNGPEWFEVFFPDGSIAEYGINYNQNATVIPAGNNNSTVLTWYINKYMDRNGNYMLYYYRNRGPQTVVDYILYTGNGTANVQPMNRIDFYYEERADENFAFVGGGQITQNLLLTKIVVKPEMRKAVEYQFKYFFDDDLKTTKLNEVKYFSQNTEVNSTKIVWNENNSSYFNRTYFSLGSNNSFNTCSGDFNGDGIDELALISGEFVDIGYTQFAFRCTGLSIYFYNEDLDCFVSNASYSFPSLYLFWAGEPIESFDSDGDGIDEIRVKSFTESDHDFFFYDKVFKVTGQDYYTGLSEIRSRLILPYPLEGTHPFIGSDQFPNFQLQYLPNDIFVDFDGDGKQDEFIAYFLVRISNPPTQGFVGEAKISDLNITFRNELTNFAETVFLGDFNGNGKTDIFYVFNDHTEIFEYSSMPITYSNGSGFTGNGFHKIYNSTFPNNQMEFYVGDFNGDRKTDILTYSNQVYEVAYSNGKNGFSNSGTPVNIGYYPGYLKNIIDLDGDGKEEIVYGYHYNTDKIFVYSINKDGSTTMESVSGTFNLDSDWKYGDFNGDGYCDIFGRNFQNDCFVNFALKNDKAKFVQEVVSGNGEKDVFELKPLTNGDVYEKNIANSQVGFPLIAIQPAFYAVRDYYRKTIDDVVIANTQLYYKSLLFNKENRSLCGFLETQSKDVLNNATTTTHFSTDNYFLQCVPLETNVKVLKQTAPGPHFTNIDVVDKYYEYYPINSGFNPLCSGGLNNCRQNTFLKKVTTIDKINNRKTIQEFNKYFDVNSGRKEQTITTVYESADANAQPIITSTQTNSLSTSVICNWFETQLNESVITVVQHSDNNTYTRTSQFVYNVDGTLQKAISDPSTTAETTTTIDGYDDFGHPLSTTADAPIDQTDPLAATNKVEYEPTGRFAVKKINALNLVEATISYNAWGQATSSIDANGHETRYEYDALNRLKTTIYPDGTTETSGVVWVQNNPEILFKATAISTGNLENNKYFDAAGRLVLTESRNMSNQIVYSDISYNIKGQEISRSLPYMLGFSPQNSIFEYDYLGRITKQTMPDNSFTESIYTAGQVVTKVSKNGITQQKTEQYDGAGRLIAVVDNNNISTHYTYFASGKPHEAWVDGMQQYVSMQYDLQGNRTLLSDPDAGNIASTYNAFGQLLTQTDARGLTTEWMYDILGRPIQKNENEGEFVTTWIYDNSPNGIGMLSGVFYSNGTSDEYYYDGLSRPIRQKQTIDGKEFTMQSAYDNLGRTERITYADGFTVKYAYQNGFLTELLDNATNASIWKATGQDQWGNIYASEYGNTLHYAKTFDDLGRLQSLTATVQGSQNAIQDWSYTYDNMGNIESRNDYVTNQNEHFTYDNLNRLRTVWKDDPAAQQSVVTLAMNYDPLGNMTEKSDIGTMTYDPSDKPHALREIELAGAYLPDNHIVEYFTSGRTKNITDMINETDSRKIEFTYGSDQQRRKTEYFENNTLITTKYFAFGNYEETIDATTNDVTKFLYIGSPDGIVAMRKTVNGASQMYYVLTDNLGSIDAVVPAVTGVMPVVEYYSYDAWGNRRNPNDWSQTETRTTFITDRGYTGHEMLDAFGLINANGRIYEPATGRFLSPDNYVQAPDFSQSFNRYAYCWNNPLNLTDPSGEFAWFVPVIIGAVVGAEIGGTWADHWVHWAPWNWSDQKKSWTAAGIGAMAGAGAGLAFSWGLTGLGVNVSKIYTGAAGTSATTLGWDIGMNAILTSNINMLSSWAQGRDVNEIALSGASGFIAGAIGGAIGYLYRGRSANPQATLRGIKATNYYTGIINGATDRLSNSVYNKENTAQTVANTILGAGEGLYLGWLGNKNLFTSHSWHDIKYFAGRYISAGVTQIGTSVPGLGVTLACFHLSYILEWSTDSHLYANIITTSATSFPSYYFLWGPLNYYYSSSIFHSLVQNN